MSAQTSLDAAASRLQKALQRLDQATEGRVARERIVHEAEEEVQRQTADRGRLAAELDGALAKVERLDQVNREVSRRLVAAMETIRSVLERRREA